MKIKELDEEIKNELQNTTNREVSQDSIESFYKELQHIIASINKISGEDKKYFLKAFITSLRRDLENETISRDEDLLKTNIQFLKSMKVDKLDLLKEIEAIKYLEKYNPKDIINVVYSS
jgi:site-specific recombinase XerD